MKLCIQSGLSGNANDSLQWTNRVDGSTKRSGEYAGSGDGPDSSFILFPRKAWEVGFILARYCLSKNARTMDAPGTPAHSTL